MIMLEYSNMMPFNQFGGICVTRFLDFETLGYNQLFLKVGLVLFSVLIKLFLKVWILKFSVLIKLFLKVWR